MQIDLSGKSIDIRGEENPIAAALRTALTENRAVVRTQYAGVPDMLIVSLPLLPAAGTDPEPLIVLAEDTAEAMHRRGSGRILFLMSAAAGMPMRRHADFSRRMAGALTTVRTLAMRYGPHVLINAVGVGAIGEDLVAGDAAMLGHASVKRPGTIAEVVDTALFFADPLNSYTTGQMLSVDGGWSAGYGRNF